MKEKETRKLPVDLLHMYVHMYIPLITYALKSYFKWVRCVFVPDDNKKSM